MKTFLMILGGIFGAIMLVLGGFFIYSVVNGTALDKESKDWVDNVAPQIISSWDSEKLVENVSSDFLKTISRDEVNLMFSQLKKDLGTFKKYTGSTGEGGITINNFKQSITSRYTVTADYQNGLVEIFIQGVKENNQWKINNFQINAKGARGE